MKPFTILNGPQAGATFELEKDRMVIGREDGQDLVLQDDRVSRCHIALERRGEAAVVIDMGSSNGAFVNDKMVFEQELREGDVLTLGRTLIRYGEPRSMTALTGLEDAAPGTVGAAAGGEETLFVDQPSDPTSITIVGQTNPNGATVIGGATGATNPDGATVIGDVSAEGVTRPDSATVIGGASAEGATRPNTAPGVGGVPGEPPPGDWERVVPANADAIADVAAFMRECGALAGLAEDSARELDLAARQVGAMLLRQLAGVPSARLTIRCRRESGGLRVEFRYAGPRFGAGGGGLGRTENGGRSDPHARPARRGRDGLPARGRRQRGHDPQAQRAAGLTRGARGRRGGGMDEILARLEANQIRNLGPATYRYLVATFGSWPAARRASARDLEAMPGVGPELAEAIRSPRVEDDPAEEVRRAERLGLRILTEKDAAYPEGLRRLEDAPLTLYVRGDLRAEDAVAVAVVGARRCSNYGETQAERLASGLASAGLTVVSGLARGVDAAAHRGALRGKGRTVAVLGCGLGRVYPREHRELGDRVAENGALVSALPVTAPPRPKQFPIRNRWIAALSLGVLVVEATQRSGALITARLAGEMGKEVFAVPGDISRPQSRGCHDLIRDGAKLVTTVADVIEELDLLRQALRCVADDEPPPPPPSLTGVELKLYEALGTEPVDMDTLVRLTEIRPANAASALLALELRGLVKQLPGKRFVRGR